MTESKAADVFAFGMFATEVFTGKIPFGEQKNEDVVINILAGARPKMPGNAQDVGLTGEMWKLLEDCWHQNPKKRPAMKEVVKRLQKFVEGNTVTECVQTSSYVEPHTHPCLNSLKIDIGNHHLLRKGERTVALLGRRLAPFYLRQDLPSVSSGENLEFFDPECHPGQQNQD